MFLLFTSYSLSSSALFAEQKIYNFTSTAIFNNNTEVLGGYSADKVMGAVDFILEAAGARANLFTVSEGNFIKGSFTALVESANGSIPAKYVTMAISPDHLDCSMVASILHALLKYLPVQNYEEQGKCRVSTGSRLKSTFMAKFEILTRTDPSFQPASIYTRQDKTPFPARNYALYFKNNQWLSYFQYPSPYGSIERPKVLNNNHPLVLKAGSACDRKYDFETQVYRSCTDESVVTIHEVEN